MIEVQWKRGAEVKKIKRYSATFNAHYDDDATIIKDTKPKELKNINILLRHSII